MFRLVKTLLKWSMHPIFVFVTLQIVWVAVTVLWVVWFLNSANEIARLAQSLGSEGLDQRIALTYLILGCVLLGVLLVGTVVLFIFGQRQSHLMSLQRNFVSSVTHELRSPLANIQLSLETLAQRAIDPKTQEDLLTRCLNDSSRLRRLVEQILSAARLDRGPFTFTESLAPLILTDVLDKVGQKLLWLDPELTSRLEVSCPKNATIKGTEVALLLVISNLVENAIRYSPAKSPIHIEVLEPTPYQVMIKVIDQGFGLERRERKRIFRMFYRTQSAYKNAIAGSGLGLFIVRQTLKSLRGRIWVESPGINRGSVFYISLPKN